MAIPPPSGFSGTIKPSSQTVSSPTNTATQGTQTQTTQQQQTSTAPKQQAPLPDRYGIVQGGAQPPPDYKQAQQPQSQMSMQQAPLDQMGDWLHDASRSASRFLNETGSNIAEGVDQQLGELLGNLVASGTQIWNQGQAAWDANMPPPETMLSQFGDILTQYGYTPTSLAGDVGQNWTTAMDPAAWEQMAANRLAAHREDARATMNDQERRMRGSAARSGFNPAGGVGNIYANYGKSMQDAERNIFNDTLGQQMAALQGASNYALGQQGLDQALYQDILGKMYGAAGIDKNAAEQRYVGFDDAMGGVASLLSTLMGQGAQGAGSAGGGIGDMIGSMIMGGIIPVPGM